MKIKKDLSSIPSEALYNVLETRFKNNKNRHKGLDWVKIKLKLKANPDKLQSLNEMERTGGEPDVIGFDNPTENYIFYDCSTESPIGRRSLCYDLEALESRKKYKPKDNIIDMATSMGIETSILKYL